MADLLAGCRPDSWASVFADSSRFLQDFLASPLEKMAEERRAGLARYAEAETARYEKLLTSLREMYKSGQLQISGKGWLIRSTGEKLSLPALTSLPLSETDTRAVLLTAGVADGSEICTGDMPLLKDVPVDRQKTLSGLDTDTAWDLGIALPAGGGQYVLLHFRQDGSFRMQELPEALFVELLVTPGVPRLDIGSIE